MRPLVSGESLGTPAVLLALTIASGASATALSAQGAELPPFDVDRAWMSDSTLFRPYLVDDTRLLRDALNDGLVEEDTGLLVVVGDESTLALITREMAYHHIAQGDLDGEPWMVSF